ncbi:hypothetical protein CYMTET_12890 [Cymbomonas tetramitiformis]|uniref:Peroxidase n=1 Tax=Cymbomonas tetramitiformis TaxID=36881 RepID=A0AAE0LBZ6_9CHLO|nr:hypothetical protein CYMTET_12890 [Cymbomonas tetramitiformis]
MAGVYYFSTYIVFLLLACLEAIRCQSYHAFNGYGNNIRNPGWGIAGGELIRYPVPQAYSDGISAFTESKSGKDLPGARAISLKFVGKDRESVVRSERGTTDFVTYLGQFFDHDFDLNEHSWFDYGVGGEDAPIPIPECDPWYDPACEGDKTIGFSRTGYNGSTPVDKPRQQINGITSFLDGSVVYGSSFEWASKLRAYRDGKLLTSDGNLLPWNNMGLSMANDVNREDMMYAAGDKRANVNPAVIAIQTLFMRNHNRLAEMYADENPGWNDEDLYYAARKWNIAQMQAVCNRALAAS